MAKLLLGEALKCSSYCIWVSGHHIPAPHVPGHPISIFDEGVKLVFFFFYITKTINLSKSMYVAIVSDDLVFSITTVAKENDEWESL